MSIQNKSETVVISITDSLAGPLVKKCMSEIRTTLLSKDTGSCVLDFTSCAFIDSSGIGALVSLNKDFQCQNVQLVLRNLKEEILELFADTGLNSYFAIEKTGELKKSSINLFETSMDIRLTINKEIVGDVCVLLMSGVLNHPMGSQYFKQQLLMALINNRLILLDMEELTFFDSLSVNAVMNMNKLLKSTGGALQICGVNYIIRDLFKTLYIDAIIPVFDTQEEAFKAWGVKLV